MVEKTRGHKAREYTYLSVGFPLAFVTDAAIIASVVALIIYLDDDDDDDGPWHDFPKTRQKRR